MLSDMPKCLTDIPDKTSIIAPPSCGNGFVEKGEECDCGTPEVSAQTGTKQCLEGAKSFIQAVWELVSGSFSSSQLKASCNVVVGTVSIKLKCSRPHTVRAEQWER